MKWRQKDINSCELMGNETGMRSAPYPQSRPQYGAQGQLICITYAGPTVASVAIGSSKQGRYVISGLVLCIE